MKATLDFLLNGERVSLAGEDASRTVLAWLRESRRLVGTKEGCAEGDCGACTAVVAELAADGSLRYLPVNTCILCLGALEGRELLTVEALKRGAALHPVQQEMVDCHGSQCGFCTPGFVMALYARFKSPAPMPVADAIAGNLCRCTGYRPIVEAGERAQAQAGSAAERAEDADRAARLAALPRGAALIESAGRQFFIPATSEELGAFLAKHPDATLLAGGTDVGLWITKQHRDFARIAYTGRIADLKFVREGARALEVGGAVTYAEAEAALAGLHPDIAELLRRLGAVQVRSTGTLAGNIANGSPIGDSMPVLLALDAEVLLPSRNVKLSEFYTGYRRNVMRPGEFIVGVRIPRLPKGARFGVYKLTKRFDQDISAVCAAFCVNGGEARFGFGGMAATPARAKGAEQAWFKDIDAACAALAEDFKPLSDQRASSWYRLTAAQGLLRKFHAGRSARELLLLK